MIRFQYTATLFPLNPEEIGRHLYRISKIKPLKSKYNRKGINFPSRKDDWKKFPIKNNPTIALNVLYLLKMNIYPA